MGQIKILTVPRAKLAQVLRGEVRMQLPFDAEVQALTDAGRDAGFRIYSSTFAPVKEGAQLPCSPAVLIRSK